MTYAESGAIYKEEPISYEEYRTLCESDYKDMELRVIGRPILKKDILCVKISSRYFFTEFWFTGLKSSENVSIFWPPYFSDLSERAGLEMWGSYYGEVDGWYCSSEEFYEECMAICKERGIL